MSLRSSVSAVKYNQLGRAYLGNHFRRRLQVFSSLLVPLSGVFVCDVTVGGEEGIGLPVYNEQALSIYEEVHSDSNNVGGIVRAE